MNETPKKKDHIVAICTNRRATFDYHVEKKIEVGIELKGSEVKSCRQGKVQLVDAFAAFEKGECFLHKAHISEYAQSGPYFNHLAVRRRKLLMHKRELRNYQALSEQEGYTLVPLAMYFKNGIAKVELGLAKGKTQGDKRASIKDKEDIRQLNRAARRPSSPAAPKRNARSSSAYDED